jgi:hypothetical protein
MKINRVSDVLAKVKKTDLTCGTVYSLTKLSDKKICMSSVPDRSQARLDGRLLFVETGDVIEDVAGGDLCSFVQWH